MVEDVPRRIFCDSDKLERKKIEFIFCYKKKKKKPKKLGLIYKEYRFI